MHAAVITAAVAASFGCAAELGDSCTTNVECSPNGDRTCDTSQAGGYCTVLGCAVGTCPDKGHCVRFFQTGFLSRTCDPITEDAVGSTSGCSPACDPPQRCIDKKCRAQTDTCRPDEICLGSGFCAARTQERRFCMQACSDDTDCRGGYECRSTGTAGAEFLIDPAQLDVTQARFCGQAQ